MSDRIRFRRIVVLGIALSVSLPSPARAQWPPWIAKDEPPPSYPTVLVEADSLSADGTVILDARDVDRWTRGHVAGAVSFPPEDMNVADVGPRLARLGISGHERLACVGDRDDLVDVAQLFWLLEAAGCPDVRILNGGLESWSTWGGTPSVLAPVLPPAQWMALPDERRVARLEFVREHFGRPDPGRPDVEILDARSEFEWSGVGNPEGGHIPHSLPVDLAAFVRADGRFAPAESIRALLDRVGPRPSTTVDLSREFVAVDDGVSGAGALIYFALRLAGVEHVRYFPGGWAEWRANDAPRVRIADATQIRELFAEAERGSRQMVLVDVRGAADFAAGHIPNALLLAPTSIADSLGVTLAREFPGLDRARATFVAYCYGVECVRSRNAATIAAQQGFFDCVWFRGGSPEWIASGGERSRGD